MQVLWCFPALALFYYSLKFLSSLLSVEIGLFFTYLFLFLFIWGMQFTITTSIPIIYPLWPAGAPLG